MTKSVYIIGSLRNPAVPETAAKLRDFGFDVFDDWYAAGPEADDKWREYERNRGRSYEDALKGYAAQHVFQYDRSHLDRCEAAILVLPAGRSGHLELGYFIGQGKPGYILLDGEYDRWDVMYAFATGVFRDVHDIIADMIERAKSREVVFAPRVVVNPETARFPIPPEVQAMLPKDDAQSKRDGAIYDAISGSYWRNLAAKEVE